MITLPLVPLWFAEAFCSLLVIIFAVLSFRIARRLMAQDPENALWLFFRWLTTAFVVFACTHAVSHTVQDLITFFGFSYLGHLRRVFGGFDTTVYVVIATITLFFYDIQRLYRRMAADHRALEATSQEILSLNREMEALVMERTMAEMALGMAHGIRNPLHVIGGFSHRLLKKTDPDDPTRAWATAIAEEAKRIEHMVERFESLAQRKSSFFAQEDLNLIVEETLMILDPELESKDRRLVTQLYPDQLLGRLNKHLLKVALAHLVRNAIEATRPGGEIRVATSVEKEQAVLVIQDNGRGMAPEVVEKVFIPFYTTKLGGTGLGMVFVRQIVEEHRGTIDLSSRVGQGTIVTIKIPRRFGETPEMNQ